MPVEQITIHDQEGSTNDEMDIALLQGMEKLFETGPIIGEAREVLLHMARNIRVRDLILDSMNVELEQRKEMFEFVGMKLIEMDKDILKKRAEAAQ